MTTRLLVLGTLAVALCCLGLACRDSGTARDLPRARCNSRGRGDISSAALQEMVGGIPASS